MKHRYSCIILWLGFSEDKSAKEKGFEFVLGMSALPPVCHYRLLPSKLLKVMKNTLKKQTKKTPVTHSHPYSKKSKH